MNSCKAFFSLNWNIFVCDIAKVLGFKSEKALAYAQRCSDHHKTWQIIGLMYTGITDELLVPFIRSCKKDGIQPTVQSYWTWNQDVCNPNYAYMQQMVFTSLHAMMLFRIGIRNGNAHAANAGKRRVATLFYARNHPNYQRIMALDKFWNVMMPEKVKKAVEESVSTSRIGNTAHYQGGDACLEEINKNAKSWISPHVSRLTKNGLKYFGASTN